MNGPILVTGAAGFIGSHLTERLVGAGATVHALLRPGTDPWRWGPALRNVEVHRADLRDPPLLAKVVRQVRPRTVFHLAASTVGRGPDATARERELLRQTNVEGTRALFEALDDAGTIVRLGSLVEYGPGPEPWRETAEPSPGSAYGASVLDATRWVEQHARMPVVTLRPSLVYGAWRGPDSVLSLALRRFRANEPLEVRRPSAVRDPVHVSDVVEACLAAARARAHGIFNVGAGRPWTVGDMIAHLARALEVDPALARYGHEPGDTLVGDVSRVRRELGWSARLSFEDGVAAMLEAPDRR